MHTGSCLCRAVRFEVAGELAPIQACHCGDCRKAQGGAFGTNIPVATANFTLLSGEAELTAYESSPGKERVFCRRCGGPVFSRLKSKPEVVRLRAGTLDEPVAAELGSHAYVASKASWWPITDDLPSHPGERPAEA
ncbi:GFA family protein [Phenylobacterium sp.]|uniref:GFA family protein n=1 Tax=Phenylobacterium sp. TaxID=1871053 RepID=UPI002735F262|nr:GFA family protein [Phenylobacterium sp.]MDP3852928.1 GFA family protein [Phenylobacterium sp.]